MVGGVAWPGSVCGRGVRVKGGMLSQGVGAEPPLLRGRVSKWRRAVFRCLPGVFLLLEPFRAPPRLAAAGPTPLPGGPWWSRGVPGWVVCAELVGFPTGGLRGEGGA